MIDIYNLPLYYISFHKNQALETRLGDQGFNDVHHFRSIDGRAFDPFDLRNDGIISIRSFTDLITKRRDHAGLPSQGAVGCTMSHEALWQKCADGDMKYMIIVEEDVKFTRQFTKSDIKYINNTLSYNNGLFTSGNFKDGKSTYVQGLQFYIITQTAAKVLVEHCYPIDVQTDYYIAHLHQTGLIKVDGYLLTSQYLHKSKIQDVCIICMLPSNNARYMSFAVVLLIMVVIGISLSIRCYMT